jgi:hypothetical protein
LRISNCALPVTTAIEKRNAMISFIKNFSRKLENIRML